MTRGQLYSAVVLSTIGLACPDHSGAIGCATESAFGPAFSGYPGVNVSFSANFPYPDAISLAMSVWNGAGCGHSGGSGFDYPYFAFAGPYSVGLDINFQEGHAASRECESNGVPAYCEGERSGRTITLYSLYGPDGTWATPISDINRMTNIIAHEIGHTLGLGHDSCPNGLMNASIPSSPSISGDECSQVDVENSVPGEIGGGSGGGGTPYVCTPEYEECPSTPVIINLSAGPYLLTSLEGGVVFDIDADGMLDAVSWTEADAAMAFLWLDRNANGLVDSGAELFGDNTPLADGGKASNGFHALSELDANTDGVINGSDSGWTSLRLWIDANHNGETNAGEVWTIAESGVTEISLDYRWVGRTDQFGNLFRYQSRVVMVTATGQEVPRPVYDILLMKAPM